MIQVVPAQCRLQRRYHGMAGLGYRVLNLDGTLFSLFTQRGVVAIAPGYYTVLGGVPAPAAGGTIIWGQNDQDILPWPIDPAPVAPDNSEQLASLARAMTELAERQPAKPDKIGYGLDRATLATVGEMFGRALEQYSATEIHTVERITGQFAELAAAHGESARTVVEAATGLRQMTERVRAETRGIIEHQRSQFDEETAQLCATVAEIAARPVVPHEDVVSLRMALSDFVEAALNVQPDEELIRLRQAVAEFVEAAEAEPAEPQQYAEDEAAAMLEAAVRVLAREDE